MKGFRVIDQKGVDGVNLYDSVREKHIWNVDMSVDVCERWITGRMGTERVIEGWVGGLLLVGWREREESGRLGGWVPE